MKCRTVSRLLVATLILVSGLSACGRRQTQHMFQPCTDGAACPRCKGQGQYRCETCFGRGQVPCAACGQSGNKVCGVCNGSGVYLSQRCFSCNGMGRSQCYACNGSRFQTCGACEGKGMISCGRYFTQYRCKQCGATFDYKASKCTKCGAEL